MPEICSGILAAERIEATGTGRSALVNLVNRKQERPQTICGRYSSEAARQDVRRARRLRGRGLRAGAINGGLSFQLFQKITDGRRNGEQHLRILPGRQVGNDISQMIPGFEPGDGEALYSRAIHIDACL